VNTVCMWHISDGSLQKKHTFLKEMFVTLSSVNTVHFIESSWICTSLKEIMVCAGLVLTATGVPRWSVKDFFL